MTYTAVPGYLGAVTLNAGDLSVYGNVMGVNLRKGVGRKARFGVQYQRAAAGTAAGSFSAAGDLAVEGPIAALITAFNLETPVAFTMQLGELAGATDAGKYEGDCIISGLDWNADAEGEWSWSVSAEIDGEPTYTAPA